jgi:hypothetical protein
MAVMLKMKIILLIACFGFAFAANSTEETAEDSYAKCPFEISANQDLNSSCNDEVHKPGVCLGRLLIHDARKECFTSRYSSCLRVCEKQLQLTNDSNYETTEFTLKESEPVSTENDTTTESPEIEASNELYNNTNCDDNPALCARIENPINTHQNSSRNETVNNTEANQETLASPEKEPTASGTGWIITIGILAAAHFGLVLCFVVYVGRNRTYTVVPRRRTLWQIEKLLESSA